MANPMAVTLDQYNAASGNFNSHYFLDQCSSAFTGQDIQVSWSDFSGAVTSFIDTNSLDPASVALRFVFCYDAANTKLYLRMQILTMTADGKIPNQFDLNPNPSVWYEISDSGMSSTTDHSLIDAAYFNNFYYCAAASCQESSLQPLGADSGNYTQNVVMPWAIEVLQMYTDNSSPGGGNIGFTTCSFQAPASAPTLFPETLVVYLTDAAGNKLIDNSPATGFQNKAADYGTMCPFSCHDYQIPVS